MSQNATRLGAPFEGEQPRNARRQGNGHSSQNGTTQEFKATLPWAAVKPPNRMRAADHRGVISGPLKDSSLKSAVTPAR